MDNQICIDFGTSSTRAAISYRGDVYPLRIAVNSTIDNASIPSAIFVSKDGDNILFGHEAIVAAISSTDYVLYEKSPKKWLLDDLQNPGTIDTPVSGKYQFSRRTLLNILVGLSIQQSYSSAFKYLDIKPGEANNFGLRISHPSWDAESKVANDQLYRTLLSTAANLANQKLGWSMTGSEIDKLMNFPESGETSRLQEIEVEEPIAAAITLFGGFPENKRALALVIDIGAGTIDLGLFNMVVPENSMKPAKLKQCAQPKSIIGAGDRIDQALIDIVNVDDLSVRNAIQFKNMIRENKELLFTRGELVIGDSIRINLKTLTESPSLRKMAKNLEATVSDMMTEATKRLSAQTQSGGHRLDEVFVVFAGGGANIKFLRDAVTKGVKCISGMNVNYEFRQNQINLSSSSIDASIERMAVALGGCVDIDLWPDSKVKNPIIMGWGWNPKQKFGGPPPQKNPKQRV